MKINDKKILQIFLGKNSRINTSKINEYPEIKEYLETRYDYFNGKYGDVIKLIRDGYKEWPKCQECGKYLTYLVYGVRKYCSYKCANSNSEKNKLAEKTCLKHYGVKNPSQSEKIKRKKEQTCLKHFGSKQPFLSKKIINKIKKTNLKNLGVIYPLQSEKIKEKLKMTVNSKSKEEWKNIVRKRENTNLQKRGVKNPSQDPKIKKKKQNTCFKHYGVKSSSRSEIVKEKTRNNNLKKYGTEYPILKMNETKRKNGTFNTSKPEERIYEKLCKDFGKKNILRNYYKDSRYPFRCDFYIKSKDLFIECNFHWTHGEHWFDENSKEDLKTLQKWKNKNTKFYDSAIEVWTKRDLNKRNAASQNKINYVVFWNEKDYDKWINKNCPNKFQNKIVKKQ